MKKIKLSKEGMRKYGDLRFDGPKSPRARISEDGTFTVDFVLRPAKIRLQYRLKKGSMNSNLPYESITATIVDCPDKSLVGRSRSGNITPKRTLLSLIVNELAKDANFDELPEVETRADTRIEDMELFRK